MLCKEYTTLYRISQLAIYHAKSISCLKLFMNIEQSFEIFFALAKAFKAFAAYDVLDSASIDSRLI